MERRPHSSQGKCVLQDVVRALCPRDSRTTFPGQSTVRWRTNRGLALLAESRSEHHLLLQIRDLTRACWNKREPTDNRHPDLGFAGSHAAAIKHTVIRTEKTMGVVKAYLQLKAVKRRRKWRAPRRCCARGPKSLPEVRPAPMLIPPQTKETRRKKARTR
jgi:hypothetical protein